MEETRHPGLPRPQDFADLKKLECQTCLERVQEATVLFRMLRLLVGFGLEDACPGN